VLTVLRTERIGLILTPIAFATGLSFYLGAYGYSIFTPRAFTAVLTVSLGIDAQHYFATFLCKSLFTNNMVDDKKQGEITEKIN